MAIEQWSSGTIYLPAKAWPAFKKAFRAGYAKLIEADLVMLQLIHTKIEGKAAHSLTLHEAFRAVVSETRQVRAVLDWYNDVPCYPLNTMTYDDAEDLLLKRSPDGRKVKLVKPLRRHLPAVNTSTRSFSLGSSSSDIVLADTTRSVNWSVSRNKRANDEALEHPTALLLFKELNKVPWTRGSGGIISADDEYNRYEAEAPEYVLRSFGQK